MEATTHTTGMLNGRTVYLERDVSNTDRFDRLLRYVWVVPKSGSDVYFANEQLVLDGYAVASRFPPDVKYAERRRDAERDARDAGRGLWDTCGGADTPLEPTAAPRPRPSATPRPRSTPTPEPALVSDCSAFGSFQEASAYYASHPAAQPDLDPNGDGRACEVYFGVDQQPVAPAGPAGGGCDPSYPDVCIPPYPPDLDCPQVGYVGFHVVGPDPHGFDRDRDGIGCEG